MSKLFLLSALLGAVALCQGAFTEGPFRPAVTRTIDDYCKHEGFIPGPDPT
ncbi:unnamed protein product, partial [Oppiella nova]